MSIFPGMWLAGNAVRARRTEAERYHQRPPVQAPGVGEYLGVLPIEQLVPAIHLGFRVLKMTSATDPVPGYYLNSAIFKRSL
jgi:hypothetical protein